MNDQLPTPPMPGPAPAVEPTSIEPPAVPVQPEPQQPLAQAQPPAVVGTVVGRIDLPSGGWVVLRDPLELRAKDRRAVQKNINDPDRKVASALDLTDGTICMLVESWSVPYLPNAPLPRDEPDILGELRIPDQQVLENAAAPAMRVLFPAENPTSEDDMKPGTPTPPAGG